MGHTNGSSPGREFGRVDQTPQQILERRAAIAHRASRARVAIRSSSAVGLAGQHAGEQAAGRLSCRRRARPSAARASIVPLPGAALICACNCSLFIIHSAWPIVRGASAGEQRRIGAEGVVHRSLACSWAAAENGSRRSV